MSRDASPTLVYETADGLARATLAGREVTLGRDAGSDVHIEHPTVSRRHARLVCDDDAAWRYEDLASRNGTRASVAESASLQDGEMLRLGRVRAWFFRDAPPAGWSPDDEPPASRGKLVRCRCGHVGWAPDYTAGLTVRCKACRGEIVVGDDREPTHSVPTRVAATCPGCRTAIAAGDASRPCPECGVRMHVACHRELGGCATYGCSRVNELRSDPPAATDGPRDADGERPASPLSSASSSSSASRRDRWPIVTWTLVGLVTFGLPAFAWAGVAIARKRSGRNAILAAIVGGGVGAAASFVVWSLAMNDGAWPW